MQNSVSVLHPQHRDSRYRASAALFHAKARVSPEKTAGNLTYEQAAKTHTHRHKTCASGKKEKLRQGGIVSKTTRNPADQIQ